LSVVDASAYLDSAVSAATAVDLAAELGPILEVPAIFTAEVASGLRKLVARGKIEPDAAREGLARVLATARIEHPFDPFAERAWELRNNMTVYDAWYVALAESLDTELLTTDRRLARASGPRCPVVLVA